MLFFPFNQNIISVKQFRSFSCPSGLICVQNCLQKDKNLIGIQSVKHSLDWDHAGHYVGLHLGLNVLLKKNCFDKFTKIYGNLKKNWTLWNFEHLNLLPKIIFKTFWNIEHCPLQIKWISKIMKRGKSTPVYIFVPSLFYCTAHKRLCHRQATFGRFHSM